MLSGLKISGKKKSSDKSKSHKRDSHTSSSKSDRKDYEDPLAYPDTKYSTSIPVDPMDAFDFSTNLQEKSNYKDGWKEDRPDEMEEDDSEDISPKKQNKFNFTGKRSQSSQLREESENLYNPGGSRQKVDPDQEEENKARATQLKQTQSEERARKVTEISDKIAQFGGSFSAMEANSLAAEMFRARLNGTKLRVNIEKCVELKREELQLRLDTVIERNSDALKGTEVLSKFNARGKLIEYHRDEERHTNKKKAIDKYDDEGNRVAYFNDDDMSVQDMLRREKNSTANDFDAEFRSSLMKMSHKMNFNDMDQVDEEELLKMYSEKQGKYEEKKRDALRRKAIEQHKRTQAIYSSCFYCLANEKNSKYNLISLGNFAYLSVPSHKPFVFGHCTITPNEHVLSLREAEDECYDEIRNFMKSIVGMFATQGKSVLFVEYVRSLESVRHTKIDCIPLIPRQEEIALMCVRQSLLDCDMEWGDNKQLINTQRKGGLRASIPKGFAYIHADLNCQGGFAHTIEDKRYFRDSFADEIIGSIVELDKDVVIKPKKWSSEENKDYISKFTALWKPFDWTDHLHQE